MRTIELHMEDRSVEVTGIPDDAKITYGGVRPDQPGSRSNTVRIYGKNRNQIAVFRGVVWFMDKTLSVKDIEPPKKRDWL